MTSMKTGRIVPTVIRLNPDAVLPPSEHSSREELVDAMVGELRTILTQIPKASGLALVEDRFEIEPAKPRVLSSRKFIIEAMEVDPCLPELKGTVSPSVYETMKALLKVFGMVPKSIEIVEQ